MRKKSPSCPTVFFFFFFGMIICLKQGLFSCQWAGSRLCCTATATIWTFLSHVLNHKSIADFTWLPADMYSVHEHDERGFECVNGIIHVWARCVSAPELQQQLHSTLLKVIPQPACLQFSWRAQKAVFQLSGLKKLCLCQGLAHSWLTML